MEAVAEYNREFFNSSQTYLHPNLLPEPAEILWLDFGRRQEQLSCNSP